MKVKWIKKWKAWKGDNINKQKATCLMWDQETQAISQMNT